MSAVAMCKLCAEYEIATFQVHNDFCSDVCADRAYDYVGAADFSDFSDEVTEYDILEEEFYGGEDRHLDSMYEDRYEYDSGGGW
jgi:hypothetical protein